MHNNTDCMPPLYVHSYLVYLYYYGHADSEVKCHEIVTSDKTELTGIIAEHGSWRIWCSSLKISEGTCNGLKHSGQHFTDTVLEVAEAYLKVENPCWEDVVRVLCKDIKMNNPARKVAERHNVNYVCLCVQS